MSIESTDQTSIATGPGAADGSADGLLPGVAGRVKIPRSWLLLPIVFLSGVAEMSIQMCASRYLNTRFGSSLLIWANLIGFTMICLAAGYALGGRLADRRPRPAVLYALTGLASLLMLLIPGIAQPVMDGTLGAGLFPGSLLSIGLLFVLPLTLLGCVPPFAVRLLLNDVQRAGRTAGMVSSLATTGSILGTFLPVLLVIPTVGTNMTLYVFAVLLLVGSAVGLLTTRQRSEVRGQRSEVGDQESEPNLQSTNYSQGNPLGRNLQSNVRPSRTESVPFLLPIVFTAGMTVMATEMCASRLIQPYFGDSQLIWACLIGFIIISLAIGYFLGGRLSYRFPRPSFLYQLIGAAALVIGLIPILSTPILKSSSEAFRTADGPGFFGALFGVILLFAIPVILLGCVSPFSIRLLMNNVRNGGLTAGTVSSLSTVGSILGTFLPVLVLIPLVGTRNTLYIFSIVLLSFSTVGLFLTMRRRVPIFAAMLLGVILLGAFVTFGVKVATYGTLVAEKESAYNYIQVVRRDNGQTDLVLNEGHAVHSIYNPNQILTGGPWDYYMVTPFFNKGMRETDVKSALLLGLGAGTVPKQLTKAYGSQIQIDGVEIDPTIIDIGRQYFAMNEPNLNAIAQDGRYQLITSDKKYDIIGVDAYKQPYIPFHLTTLEFFRQVRAHLNPTGVAVINAGTPVVNGKVDYRLADALAQTMKQVYPNVYMINLYNIAGFFNTIVVATNQPSSIADFQQNMGGVSNSLIKEVGARALSKNSLKEWTGQPSDGSTTPPPVFTDDLAPVERLIDQVIIDYVVGGGK